MKYKIYPVYLGEKTVTVHEIFYRSLYSKDDPLKMVFGAFVLQDENGEYILVDTGAPSAAEIREKGYPFLVVDQSIDYIEAIRKIGVEPEKVKLIIMTHLHWDHAWNMENFPNAEIMVSSVEMSHALQPTKTSWISYAMIPETGGPNWIKALLQMRPFSGEAEIRPGLRTINTPGHTIGSITVLVDTENGIYALVGDMGDSLLNFTEAIPPASVESVLDWYKSYERIMAMDVKLLPVHDPGTYEKNIYG